MEPFKKQIVLTGGPCSGKTTSLPYAQEKLMDRGIRTFIVPEVATLFITGGVQDIIELGKNAPKKLLGVEKNMLLMHTEFYRRFNELADIFVNEPRVIIYDRAEMDVLSYVPAEIAKRFLNEVGSDIVQLRDRYDAVIHLVTAADGAEKFYGNGTNKARFEDLESARIADRRTMFAWMGHPHLKIIDNSTDFERKLKRVLQTLFHAIGIPAPLEIERKFLLRCAPDFTIPELANAQKIYIEQMYLMKAAGEEMRVRIRKRGQHGSFLYYRTQKKYVSPGVRHEVESFITEKEYEQLKVLRDPNRSRIIKNRYCFVYRNQYFELDIFSHPCPGLCLLEIELTEENDKVELPPFLPVNKEVTGDSSYSNSGIAKIK